LSIKISVNKNLTPSWAWWFKPVILATREVIRRIMVQGQLGQKVHKTSSQPIKKLGMVEHSCHPSYAGSINRRTIVQASLGINMRPYHKNNQSKKGW
jgi:hypothetical protein